MEGIMRVLVAKTGFLAGCLILVAASQAFAQDWPQWRGPNRDGKTSGLMPPGAWPSELTQKWKVAVGTGDASPALVGDRLYVFSRKGDDEVISCLNAANGKEIWVEKYAAPKVQGAANRHPGPRSSPVVADGKIVTLGVTGIVSCLDAASGKKLWRKDDLKGKFPRFYTSMSPLIVDDLAILQLGGGNDGTFVAYDLADGDQKWKWAGDGATYASPVLMTIDGTKVIVAQTDKRVVALDATGGKLLWKVPFAPTGMAYNAITPLVDGQTLIYSGQGRGIKALTFEKNGDSLTAKELWSNPQLGSQFSTPVLKEGLIFGLSDSGKFFCIDATSGKTAWTDEGKHGGYGAIVDIGPAIVALTSKAELIGFEPTDKEYKELGHLKVSEKPTYAFPVLSNKGMYVKDQDNLIFLTAE
jgi:outer membrane protein assembly factor BamB